MSKIILKTFLLITVLMPLMLWGETAKEGLIYSETGRDLKLYYFDENLSRFDVKVIASNCTAFQIFPSGTIYCMIKTPVLYKEKILSKFGIKLIFIKEPDNFYDFHSGICINTITKQMYFTKRETKKNKTSAALYTLNFKTGKESKLFDKDGLYFIGIPSIAPDGAKIAFYCAVESHYRLQVAFYDIKSKLTKIMGPSSTPIFPDGPYMGGSPIWNKSSSEIYFMARPPEIMKKIGMGAAIYKISIKKGAIPELIGVGGWPTKLNNQITCTLMMDKNKAKSGIWRIVPRPRKLILSGADGKVSPSGKFTACSIESDLYIRNNKDDKRILLHKNNQFGPNYWWIKLNGSQK